MRLQQQGRPSSFNKERLKTLNPAFYLPIEDLNDQWGRGMKKIKIASLLMTGLPPNFCENHWARCPRLSGNVVSKKSRPLIDKQKSWHFTGFKAIVSGSIPDTPTTKSYGHFWKKCVNCFSRPVLFNGCSLLLRSVGHWIISNTAKRWLVYTAETKNSK